jgi:hypothetical protein
MTDHIANAEAALAAFKQAISVDGEVARPPARVARAREGGAVLMLKRIWRTVLYNSVYGYWLVWSRDRSGRWRIYVSDNATASGFPAPKRFFIW